MQSIILECLLRKRGMSTGSYSFPKVLLLVLLIHIPIIPLLHNIFPSPW